MGYQVANKRKARTKMTKRGKTLKRSREAWSAPKMVGKRVSTPSGFGAIVDTRNEALGIYVALERGGFADFDHTEVTMADEQY
jgi:hypothetical protein